MALQGNLADFSLTEILQLLGTQKKTGCLMLDWNTERALVYIADGRIVATRSPGMSADDPLLRFLLKVHRLSDEQRRGLQSIHKESNRDLEDLLITGRYLEAEELKSYIERQILNDLMSLVRWENGGYRFDPKVRWPGPPLVRLSMEGALIEAARRVDEQKRFVSRFKDPYQLLGVRDLPDPDEPLMEEEKELFGIIDGQHTVAEIVEIAPLSEYEAYEALARLLEANWIEVVGRRDPGAATFTTPLRIEPGATARRSSVGVQLLIGTLVVLGVAGLPFAGHIALARWGVPSRGDDVFAAAQLRQIRRAIDLYERENGHVPDALATLVREDWIGPQTIDVPGYELRYRPGTGAAGYALELVPKPPRWNLARSIVALR